MTIILTIVLSLTLVVVVLVFAIYTIYHGGNTKHFLTQKIISIQPYLLLLFLITFFASAIYSSIHFSKFFLPEPSSVNGKATVPLYQTTLFITGITFLVTHILLFYFIYRFRFRTNSKAIHIKKNNRLELLWTIVPLLTFLFLFIWGQILWAKTMKKPNENAMEVEVMGQQFNWWVRYPGKDNRFGRFDYRLANMGIDYTDPNSKDDIIPIQLHLPKNKTIRLRMRSKDVIHSVFIPHLRVKMDAVPGMPTYIQFTPDVTTLEMRNKLSNPNFNYEITCAELCGRMHFAMKYVVIIEEQVEFDRWINNQKSWLSIHPELTK